MLPTLWIINKKGDNPTSLGLLRQAAAKREIPLEEVDCADWDPFGNQMPSDGDLVYRTSLDERAFLIEHLFHVRPVASLYMTRPSIINSGLDTLSESIGFIRENVRTPRTSLYLPPRNRQTLLRCSESVGGFPLILKAVGGSHGVGVMKIESFDSLSSVLDVMSGNGVTCILKEYIPTKQSARLIVLDGRVIDSLLYSAADDDFRSNAGKNFSVRPERFSPEIEQLAVAAVRSKNVEFGGVDIVLDAVGNGYVLEANFPCFFPRCQNMTGTDISGMIIDRLVSKSKQLFV